MYHPQAEHLSSNPLESHFSLRSPINITIFDYSSLVDEIPKRKINPNDFDADLFSNEYS